MGLAFAVTPTGGIVHELSLSTAVGTNPVGGVIQGTLYGTAESAGTAPPGKKAYGTVFEVTGLPVKK